MKISFLIGAAVGSFVSGSKLVKSETFSIGKTIDRLNTKRFRLEQHLSKGTKRAEFFRRSLVKIDKQINRINANELRIKGLEGKKQRIRSDRLINEIAQSSVLPSISYKYILGWH